MLKMENYLKKNSDYEVINIDYPSTKYKIEDIADIIHKEYEQIFTNSQEINFIGYSMGGLVTRSLLEKYRYKNLNRVVLLASPSKGSEVADFVKNNYLYKKFYGPAGQQLTTNARLSQIIGKPYYEFGVIAGNYTVDPISSYLIKGMDDGKVSIESARVEGMKDFIVVNASHLFFPQNDEVIWRSLRFVEEGGFGG